MYVCMYVDELGNGLLHLMLLSLSNSGCQGPHTYLGQHLLCEHALSCCQPLCNFVELMPLSNVNFLLCIINPQ